MTTSSSGSTPGQEPGGKPGRQPWTIARVLQWTSQYFQHRGIPSPRLDAEVLLAHVLGKDRLSLYLHYEDPVPEEGLAAYREMIRRRSNHEPVAYITGVREFYGIRLAVDPSVLIPRPETEHIVEYAIEYLRELAWETAPIRILEIGTGCGNLCIALAKHLHEARIVSVELSGAAIFVAKKNLRRYPDCGYRVRIVCGDLLEPLRPDRARFHLIVSNPPYVESESWDNLPLDVRQYEPRVALDGGPGGIRIIERILSTAGNFLLPRGALLVEIGEGQAERVLEKAQAVGSYERIRILPDYADIPRILLAPRRGGLDPSCEPSLPQAFEEA